MVAPRFACFIGVDVDTSVWAHSSLAALVLAPRTDFSFFFFLLKSLCLLARRRAEIISGLRALQCYPPMGFRGSKSIKVKPNFPLTQTVISITIKHG